MHFMNGLFDTQSIDFVWIDATHAIHARCSMAIRFQIALSALSRLVKLGRKVPEGLRERLQAGDESAVLEVERVAER